MKQVFMLLILVVFGLFASCSQEVEQETSTDKVQVTASFFSVGEITQNLLGKNGEVSLLVPLGKDPHSYEPSVSQMVEFSQADVFITQGFMFEHIEEELLELNPEISVISAQEAVLSKEFEKEYIESHEEEHLKEHGHEEEHIHELESSCESLGGTFDKEYLECFGISQGQCSEISGEFVSCGSACRHDPDAQMCTMQCVIYCDLSHTEGSESDYQMGHDEHDSHEEEHAHEHTGADPHIWLSIENMIAMTEKISADLQQLYPELAKVIKTNEEAYVTQLKELQQDYQTSLRSCQLDTIVVSHLAFGYIADEFNFEQLGFSGIAPELEASPKHLEELISEIKEKNISVIFYENQGNADQIKQVAQDLSIEVSDLNAKPSLENESYLDVMRKNLKELSYALKCENK